MQAIRSFLRISARTSKSLRLPAWLMTTPVHLRAYAADMYTARSRRNYFRHYAARAIPGPDRRTALGRTGS